MQRNRTARSAALQRRRAALVDVDSAACDDAALLCELAALKALSLVTLPAPVEAAPEPEPCLLDPAAGDPWGGVPRLSDFCSWGLWAVPGNCCPMFSCVDGKRARPAADEKWIRYKWTVYRGVAYDLTDFIQRHPAGAPLPRLVQCTERRLSRPAQLSRPVLLLLWPAWLPEQPCQRVTAPEIRGGGAGAWLVKLAIGRDCTALFESYHLRPEVPHSSATSLAAQARCPRRCSAQRAHQGGESCTTQASTVAALHFGVSKHA